MERIIAAAILGLSVDRLFTCPAFVLGLSLSNKRLALQFISGRLIGLVIFGITISLFGNFLPKILPIVSTQTTNFVFGAFSIFLGLKIIIFDLRKKPVKKDVSSSSEKKTGNKHAGCDIECDNECHSRCGNCLGFGLGIFRGLLNPCRKVIILVPIILGVSWLKGALISLAYGLSSSVYFLIAFLSAAAIGRLSKKKKQLQVFGGVSLILVGVVYLLKVFI